MKEFVTLFTPGDLLALLLVHGDCFEKRFGEGDTVVASNLADDVVRLALFLKFLSYGT